MSRKMHTATAGEGHGHADRPWVFFMVDCFFLITEFFVLTFKFKTEEAILPQKMPATAGCHPGPRSTTESLLVKVTSLNGASGQAAYEVQGCTSSLVGLTDTLANAARNGGNERYSVKVAYDAGAPWGDVMAVFNVCNKVKIAECGLVPLRDGL